MRSDRVCLLVLPCWSSTLSGPWGHLVTFQYKFAVFEAGVRRHCDVMVVEQVDIIAFQDGVGVLR